MPITFKLRVTRLEYHSSYEYPVKHHPYCLIQIGKAKDSTFIYKNPGFNPEWNQLFQVTANGADSTLKFRVFNKISLEEEDIIGEGEIELEKINRPGKNSHRIKLISSYVNIGCLVIGSELLTESQKVEQDWVESDKIVNLNPELPIKKAYLLDQKIVQSDEVKNSKESNENSKKEKPKSSGWKFTKWYDFLMKKDSPIQKRSKSAEKISGERTGNKMSMRND